jgi:hypothetical protein
VKPADPVLVLDGRLSLRATPGRRFAARVVRREGSRVILNLAGAEMETRLAGGSVLAAGDTVTLEVVSVQDGRLELRLVS